jgi:hypothetical protein
MKSLSLQELRIRLIAYYFFYFLFDSLSNPTKGGALGCLSNSPASRVPMHRGLTRYTSILEDFVAANGTTRRGSVIRNVIFDYGQVLCCSPDPNVAERMGQMFGVDGGGFWRLYDRNREALGRGDLNPEAYWSEFARDSGVAIDE